MSVMCKYLLLLLIGSLCVFSSDNVPEIMSEKDLQAVQKHYMKYPYPPGDALVFKYHTPPIQIQPHKEELNHYLFEGKGDLGRTRVFRILIAGGGTGTSLLHYAYIFKGLKVSIVFLDFSIQSLEIARKRAEFYNFGNITYIHSSIYNIPQLNLGLFDFIDCFGVLHHLPDPDEGLQMLKDSLAPNGGMIIMLYAYYGRQGVYSMQNSLKILNKNKTNSLEEEVRKGKIFYKNHNLYSRALSGAVFPDVNFDAGFYDLYLHKQDKAFTIPELYEYIEERGGLKIVHFTKERYNEVLHECPKILNHLNSKRKFAVNEMIYGSECKQTIFVSKRSKIECEASVDEMDNVPYFFVNNTSILLAASQERAFKNQTLQVHIKNMEGRKIFIPFSKYSSVFFKLISINEHTVGEIVNYCTKKFSSKSKNIKNLRKKVLKEMKRTLKSLILHNIVFLRHKSFVPPKRVKNVGIIESVNFVKI